MSLQAQNEFEEKAKNIQEYMKYFVNNLIENISIVLFNDNNGKKKIFALKLLYLIYLKLLNQNLIFSLLINYLF